MIGQVSLLLGFVGLIVGIFVTRFEHASLADRVKTLERIHLDAGKRKGGG